MKVKVVMVDMDVAADWWGVDVAADVEDVDDCSDDRGCYNCDCELLMSFWWWTLEHSGV